MIERRVEFSLMLRSHWQKLLLLVSDNFTDQKSWQIFWWRNSSLADSIFGSCQVGLPIQKIKESESGFLVLNETSWSIAIKATNWTVCWWTARRKVLLVLVFEVTLSERFSWFLAGHVVNNLCQKLPLQWFSQFLQNTPGTEKHKWHHYVTMVTQIAVKPRS